MTRLEEVLGADGYAELMEHLRPKPSEWKQWLMGALKSWSMRFGAFLLVFPELVNVLPDAIQQLEPELVATFGQGAVAAALHVIGAVSIMLRVKTVTSLKDR